MDKLFNLTDDSVEGYDILSDYRQNYDYQDSLNQNMGINLTPYFNQNDYENYIKHNDLIKKLYSSEKALKIAEVQLKLEARFYDRMRSLLDNFQKKYEIFPSKELEKDIQDVLYQYRASEPHVIKYRNKIKEIKNEIEKIKKELNVKK